MNIKQDQLNVIKTLENNLKDEMLTRRKEMFYSDHKPWYLKQEEHDGKWERDKKRATSWSFLFYYDNKLLSSIKEEFSEDSIPKVEIDTDGNIISFFHRGSVTSVFGLFKSQHLNLVTNLPFLRKIHLVSSKLTDFDLKNLIKFRHLEILEIESYGKRNKQSISKIPKFYNPLCIKELVLYWSSTISSLQGIEEMKNIEKLEIMNREGCSVYISDLTPLAGLSNIKKLGFNMVKGGRHILEPIKNLIKLKSLVISLTSKFLIKPVTYLAYLESLWLVSGDKADLVLDKHNWYKINRNIKRNGGKLSVFESRVLRINIIDTIRGMLS